jgi:hypothetical protein
MDAIVCRECGRYNDPEGLAARGFACELCGQTIPVADRTPKEPAPAPPLRLPPEDLDRPRPVYPISRVCPRCGHAEYQTRRPEKLLAFASDRVCTACQTRYTPPTPTWAAVVFILAGLPLAGFGLFSVGMRLLSGEVWALPAIGCEGFLAVLGLLAVMQGVRALLRPGKV